MKQSSNSRRLVSSIALVAACAVTLGVPSAGAVGVAGQDASVGAVPTGGLDDALNAASLTIVTRFLGLQPPQVETVAHLLAERQRATAPVEVRIAVLQQQLEAALAEGQDPAVVGVLASELFGANQVRARIQSEFLEHFGSLLSPEQIQRFRWIHRAAELQAIVPAFHRLAIHR